MESANSILSYIHSGSVANSLLAVRQSSFKTAMFGYDKEAIMSYINDIYRTATEQDRRVSESIAGLVRRNTELSVTVTKYENQLRSAKEEYDGKLRELQQKSEKDSDYTSKTKEREELYKSSISNLKEKINELQKNLFSEHRNSEVMQSQISQATDVVNKLRAELAQKDQMMAAVNNEIYRRDSIIAQREQEMQQRDYLMTSKDNEISRLNNAMSKKNNEVLNLRDYITDLEQRIDVLESRKNEISSAISNVTNKAMYTPESRYSRRVNSYQDTPRPVEPQPVYNSKPDVAEEVNSLSRRANELKRQLESVSGQFAQLENNIYQKTQSSQGQYQQPAEQRPLPPVAQATAQDNRTMERRNMNFWQPGDEYARNIRPAEPSFDAGTYSANGDASPRYSAYPPAPNTIEIPLTRNEARPENSFERLNGRFPDDGFGTFGYTYNR